MKLTMERVAQKISLTLLLKFICGAGMMGRGIALVCAKKGINVILKEYNHSRAHAGKGALKNI